MKSLISGDRGRNESGTCIFFNCCLFIPMSLTHLRTGLCNAVRRLYAAWSKRKTNNSSLLKEACLHLSHNLRRGNETTCPIGLKGRGWVQGMGNFDGSWVTVFLFEASMKSYNYAWKAEILLRSYACLVRSCKNKAKCIVYIPPVSYTHLTLRTKA